MEKDPINDNGTKQQFREKNPEDRTFIKTKSNMKITVPLHESEESEHIAGDYKLSDFSAKAQKKILEGAIEKIFFDENRAIILKDISGKYYKTELYKTREYETI
jgi:hypothetical protein